MVTLRFCAIALALAFATIGASDARAATHTVVDSDNDPYSGIYLRDGTSMGNVRRTLDRYMLYGTRVELQCGTWGESVGPYNNRRWHSVRVLTGDSAGQIGWIADRYLDTPNKANEATPGESECGAAPQPAPPAAPVGAPAPSAPVLGQAVGYFAPYTMSDTDGMRVKEPSTLNVKFESWWKSCKETPATAYSAANALLASGQSYKTLAGWSASRLAVIGYLKNATAAQLDALNYVLLIDPGVYKGELDGCDKTLKAGAAFARWLKENPQAHLAVISTSDVTQQDSSKGIQEVYFNEIRNQSTKQANLRARVLTCNYTLPGKKIRIFGRTAHERAMLYGQYWIQHEIGTTSKSCPWLSDGGKQYKPSAGWKP